jgi:uncharacterized damage-inducible protein DinB
MTYYGAEALSRSFRTVRGNTIQIAEEIPEDLYTYQVTPATRSVAETLVHIAFATRFAEQLHFLERRNSIEGFDFFGMMEKQIAEEKKPRSKAEILDLLRTNGEKFAKLLDGVTEEFLAETVQYPAGMNPPVKSRFEMLIAPKEHEMHHRGQLMMVERLLGITPHLTRNMQARVAQMKASAK